MNYLPPGLREELGRILFTVLVLLFAVGVNWMFQRQIQHRPEPLAQRRMWGLWIKNFCAFFAVLMVFSLWASKIGGLLLSVAALAAATVIACKEIIGCLLGTMYLAFTRPFMPGDYIEIADLKGEVVDAGPLSVTLTLAGDANQITGKTATIPSFLFLTNNVKNVSATGQYVSFLVRVSLDSLPRAAQHAEWLRQAAEDVCKPWLAEADREFQATERRNYVDLPSASPKVLYDFSDSKNLSLVLRFSCQPRLRVRTEQDILGRYLALAFVPSAGAALPANAHQTPATSLTSS